MNTPSLMTAVINDGVFIDSLPAREKRCGMSEAVKVALIRDRDFFLWLESNALALARFETVPLSYLIKRSAQIHMNQIAHGGDPFESGLIQKDRHHGRFGSCGFVPSV